jgi:hypothetical protein
MLDHEIITRDDYSQVISDVATSQNKIVVFVAQRLKLLLQNVCSNVT